MTRLKSIFISVMLMYMTAISFYALYQYFVSEINMVWLALAIANLIPSGFIARFFIVPQARTSPNLNMITILVIVPSVISLFLNATYPAGYNHIISLFNVITIASWVLYVFWYSRFDDRSNDHLELGQPMPDFEVENETGDKISSGKFIGSPSIFMFYRGNWCPLCMAQIKEISEQYKTLADKGVEVALISPQPHGHTKSLSKKFDVPFHFLVDAGNKAAKKLNIFSKGGTPLGMEIFGYASDTVMPTVFITDKNGKIIFADLTDNYRVRPEPATFIEALEKIGI